MEGHDGVALISFTVNPQRKHIKRKKLVNFFFYPLAHRTDDSVSEDFINLKKRYLFFGIQWTLFPCWFFPLNWYLKGEPRHPRHYTALILNYWHWICFYSAYFEFASHIWIWTDVGVLSRWSLSSWVVCLHQVIIFLTSSLFSTYISHFHFFPLDTLKGFLDLVKGNSSLVCVSCLF